MEEQLEKAQQEVLKLKPATDEEVSGWLLEALAAGTATEALRVGKLVARIRFLESSAAHHMKEHYEAKDHVELMQNAIFKAFPLSIAEYEQGGMTSAAALRRAAHGKAAEHG